MESYGFVFSSFSDGLLKSEMLFHCKAGRRGVADSVTKVSESGYLSKKLTKFFENTIIEYDYTVRINTNKQIIQFKFGSDGYNPAKLRIENGKQKVITMKDLHRLNLGTYNKSTQYFYLSLYLKDVQLTTKNCPYDDPFKRQILYECFEEHVEVDNIEYLKYDYNNVITIEEIVFNSSFQPMTPIGLITGTNFGEISSQLLLKSFHHSGIKNKDISGGIKRLNQLLCRTRSPLDENVIIVCKISEPIYDSMKSLRDMVQDEKTRQIIQVFMEDRCNKLLKTVKTIEFNQLVKNVIINDYTIDDSIKTISYVLDEDKMESFYITMENVLSAVSEIYGYTLYNDKTIIFSFECKFSQLIQYNKNILVYEVVNGIIVNCEVEFVNNDFEIICKGSKFSKIMEIPFFDKTSIYSTNPFENLTIFGVEVARKSLYNEIIRVLQFDGADIDKRYINLICDAMCVDGKINSISHITDILTNAFFEKEIKKINSYSLLKSVDMCKSVEAAVLLGQTPQMGTGGVDLIMKPL
jgi:DNA-directed RNA polymerase III subunit RPC1